MNLIQFILNSFIGKLRILHTQLYINTLRLQSLNYNKISYTIFQYLIPGLIPNHLNGLKIDPMSSRLHFLTLYLDAERAKG